MIHWNLPKGARALGWVLPLPLLVSLAQNASSQEGPAVQVPIELNSGDTAWVLVSTTLVLLMTLPGLALFYGGLVKQRNVLSMLMQSLSLAAIISLLWVLCGYSLVHDSTAMVTNQINIHSFIGGISKLGLLGVKVTSLRGSIPELLFAAFQLTFAIIATVLMIGSFAERMRFSAVLWFSSLWFFVVYIPICHMTWGGSGGLFVNWGVIDFAGGIVVHITAGCSALVACIVVGPRAGYPNMLVPPHNMTMAFTGIALLWVGWLGFNAGNALSANGTAASALLVTHLSACSATVVWMTIEWVKLGRPGVLGAATGAIAGLAAITPASGYVGPLGAIVIGGLSAAICFFFATSVKKRFRYDDSLDVFGVHGVGGFVGTVLVGIFASSSLGGVKERLDIGHQVMVQSAAATIALIYSMLATYLLLRLTHLIVGLRVTGQSEQQGLDLSEHEERGYSY